MLSKELIQIVAKGFEQCGCLFQHNQFAGGSPYSFAGRLQDPPQLRIFPRRSNLVWLDLARVHEVGPWGVLIESKEVENVVRLLRVEFEKIRLGKPLQDRKSTRLNSS